MDNLNTDNLIQEIRSGNKDAVKSVYQAYAKDVYNFSKSITGDHDSALAATKKTFLTLFKNIQNGDEPSNIRTAALKIAYDEAYKNTAPEPAAETEEAKPPVYNESLTARREAAPVIDGYDDEEEEYGQDYEEEEDDFVPPARKEEEEPESVYIPKGGYDTLKIDPVDVDEEQVEMRSHRRRPRPSDEDYDERPRSRKRQDDYDDLDEGRDDDYYDDYDDYEEQKPRRKGLFIFCIILNVILILILLWFLGGLLINLGVLPDIDLGYSWFNSHIYPLF